MPDKAKKLIAILGPTACGKTRTAALLANKFNGEIISADSRQVYKHMNLGAGKDYEDYIVDGSQIKYHLIDILEPTGEYDLFHFQIDCKKIINEINLQDKIPFLVGGTGLYLASILLNYKFNRVEDDSEKEKLMLLTHEDLINELKILNPSLHNTTDLTDKERTAKALIIARHRRQNELTNENGYEPLVIGLNLSREIMKERIKNRLRKRFASGMIAEVENLLAMGVSHEKLKFFGLEYFYISLYLQKLLNYNDMSQKLTSAINYFAKRQMTWFRKLQRSGVNIVWIEDPYFENASPLIETYLKIF